MRKVKKNRMQTGGKRLRRPSVSKSRKKHVRKLTLNPRIASQDKKIVKETIK